MIGRRVKATGQRWWLGHTIGQFPAVGMSNQMPSPEQADPHTDDQQQERDDAAQQDGPEAEGNGQDRADDQTGRGDG